MGLERHELTIKYVTPLNILSDKINGQLQTYTAKSFEVKYDSKTHTNTLKLVNGTWGDFLEKMKIISKQNINILFVLDGMIRYEDDEVFRYYILNGNVQDASPKLTYAEFDEKSLK